MKTYLWAACLLAACVVGCGTSVPSEPTWSEGWSTDLAYINTWNPGGHLNLPVAAQNSDPYRWNCLPSQTCTVVATGAIPENIPPFDVAPINEKDTGIYANCRVSDSEPVMYCDPVTAEQGADLLLHPNPPFDIAPVETDGPDTEDHLVEENHLLYNKPVPVHHFNCADPTRFLLTSDDGKKHCLNLSGARP